MKMVNSTDTAATVLRTLIVSANSYLGENACADNVAVGATKAIVDNPQAYRDFLISQRNDAIRALDELVIDHDFTDPTPDISS